MPVPGPAVRSVVAFIKLGRPLFLGGGFILFGLGAAIAAAAGHAVDLTRYGTSGTRFCRECRDQSEEFAGKDQYVDIGGGD